MQQAAGSLVSSKPKAARRANYFVGCLYKLMSKLCYIHFCVVSQMTLLSRVVSFLFCAALTSRKQGQPAAESTMAPWHATERD